MATDLQTVSETKLSGFRNMLKIENSRWWKLRNILTQSLVWLISVNLIIALPLTVAHLRGEGGAIPFSEALNIFTGILSVALALGSVILLQGTLVGEKESGTAAWVLSNPVTRTSFILAKLVANTIGIMFVGIILQAPVGYLILSYSNGAAIPIQPFITAMGLLTLYTLFYITFTLMLGSFFDTRRSILGIAIMFVALQDLLGDLIGGVIKGFSFILPNRLYEGAALVITESPLPSIIPIVSTVLFIVIFTGIAIWQFNKTEF
jgi:ABC-2 type transport system permease protein